MLEAKNEKYDIGVEVLEQKAQYFLKNKLPVHVKFKQTFWKRGIISEVSSDFFILDEFFEGKMAIFYLEIYEIQEFKKIHGKPKS